MPRVSGSTRLPPGGRHASPKLLPIIAGSVALVLTAAAITQASTPESEAGAASAHSEGSATSACVDPPSGLVTWWPGDGSAEDVQGGHDGTLTNGATFAPGMVGDAFSLDGVDDFVSVPDSPDWNFGSRAFSIDLWLEFNQLV